MKIISILCAVAGLSAGLLSGADKVALVIGIQEYPSCGSLSKCRENAARVAEHLQRSGFEVVTSQRKESGPSFDLSQDQFYEALANFRESASEAKIGIIYFAGHGVELSGEPLLLPNDAVVRKKRANIDLRRWGIPVKTLVESPADNPNLSLALICDACRTEYGDTSKKTEYMPPSDGFVFFSASRSQGAKDTGLLTRSFLTQLEEGESIATALQKAAQQVEKVTGAAQNPAIAGNVLSSVGKLSLQSENENEIWFDSLGDARERAEELELPLLIHLDADWSDYSNDMRSELMEQQAFREWSRSYVLLRLNVPQDGPRGADVDEVMSAYEVNGVPSLILCDSDQKMLSKTSGWKSGTRFSDWQSSLIVQLQKSSVKPKNQGNDYPVARWLPGKEELYVYNPYTGSPVDVAGIPAGTLVRDPTDGDAKNYFRVP